jgi:hypothetical protein
MAYYCWTCKNEIWFDVKVGVKVGRRDSCMHCGADLHVCKNCALHDPNIHNQCREPEAQFIRDRETANFCPHFDFKNKPQMSDIDQDWELRQLCPDDACVGVVGSDGRCKVCGKSTGGDPFRPSIPLPPAEAAGEESFDGDRELCVDDSCIGVIGSDGRCKVCGKPRPTA